MTNDVQFEFMGFKPDNKIKSFVAGVAERLHFSAPSDSAMTLVIEKSKGAIRASCRIASQAGTFMAEAMSDSPILAVQKIEKKIRDQINGWKMRRFRESGGEFNLFQDAI